MTETTLFMRIQNIKNGAQYTDGSFHYSLFFSPQPASATQLPTECICSNTINVTFADCLLAFYLNGNSLLPAAAAATAASSSCSAALPLCSALASTAFSISLDPGAAKRGQLQPWQSDEGVVSALLSVSGRTGKVTESHPRSAFCSVKYFSLCLASLRLSSCQQKGKTVCCCDGTERQMIAGVCNLVLTPGALLAASCLKIWLLA